MSVIQNVARTIRPRLARARWALHRASVRKGRLRPFFRRAKSRWLMISAPDPICAAQIFPFFYHAETLGRTYGIELREVTLQDFRARAPYRGEVDVVCFQTWFDLTHEQMIETTGQLRDTYLGARLVYLDWFAPADLRYAEVLDSQVDFYVKKHVLRDRDAYGRT